MPSGSRVGARCVHMIEKGSALASGVLLRRKGGRGDASLLIYFGLQRKALLVGEDGNPHVETLLLQRVAAWRTEVGDLDDLVRGG